MSHLVQLSSTDTLRSPSHFSIHPCQNSSFFSFSPSGDHLPPYRADDRRMARLPSSQPPCCILIARWRKRQKESSKNHNLTASGLYVISSAACLLALGCAVRRLGSFHLSSSDSSLYLIPPSAHEYTLTLLSVILDCHPTLTMIIILVGWVMKTATASLLSEWVGRERQLSEAWLAYSIP